MRGLLLDPVTGKPDRHVAVPASSEVEAWSEQIGREKFHENTRELLARSDRFQNTTTTNRYLVYPTAAAGITRASSGSAAWSNSTYTVVIPASTITATYYISHIILQPDPAPAVTTTYEFEMDFSTGATGSEVVALTMAFTIRNVSAVGYLPSVLYVLPEPKQIAANTQISTRLRWSVATTSYTVRGVKIGYQTV